jgi:homocysteine S-methyltransferase
MRRTVHSPDPIHDSLTRRPLLLLDGALASELERRGADLHDPLWSARVLIEAPELIQAVHREYFEAGADLAISASYQASFEGFARRGIDAAGAARLMRESVALACRARAEFWAVAAHRAGRLWPLVAASVGPYGAVLADGSEYRGDYGLSEAELMDFHRPRLRVLAASGADLLACETIPSLREALALARLLAELPGIAAWISFACRDGEHTGEGQRLAECVAQLEPYAQVRAVGVNCTGPEHIEALVRAMRAQTAKPLLVYPNSGGRYDAVGKRWEGCGATAAFVDLARGWYAAGARLIGGCCRTGPQDIRALKAWSSALAAPGLIASGIAG